MSTTQKLIAFAREHRPTDVVPVGDLSDPALMAELLTAILQQHLLGRAAPASEGEYMVPTANGYATVPARAAPPFEPGDVMADKTAWSLALVIGHLEDATARKAAAA